MDSLLTLIMTIVRKMTGTNGKSFLAPCKGGA